VVYEERLVVESPAESMETDPPTSADGTAADSPAAPRSEWRVIATVDGAHGIYEINHVTWAKRADRERTEGADEEVLITTADDGTVKVWTLKR
jgi:hypothetical protein